MPARALSLLVATIDEGTAELSGFAPPKGYEVFVTPDPRSDEVTLPNGKRVRLEWNEAALSVKTRAGKRLELVPKNRAGFEKLKREFRDEHEALDDDQCEWANGWSVERGFGGFGSAGLLLSVIEGRGAFTGGAHPTAGAQLRTFDLRTGTAVGLDRLLTATQFKALVDDIAKQLRTLKTPKGVDAAAWQVLNRADLELTIAENFAVSTQPDGAVRIEVAWESGVPSLGQLQVRFVFAAPDDAAFRTAIGVR